MTLRNPIHRRRAAEAIDKLVKDNPGLIAFPLRKVGYVEGVTPRLPVGAAVLDLSAFAPPRRAMAIRLVQANTGSKAA